MDNRYEVTANAIRQAEDALETLKRFTDIQYKAKGETMLDQIADYIAVTLSDANYMFCGNKYYHLALSNRNDYFVFYIYDNNGCSSGYPIFCVTPSGDIRYYRKLEEWMMLTLVKEWDGFKKDLHSMIKFTMEERTKSINKKLVHIANVHEQLSKWCI